MSKWQELTRLGRLRVRQRWQPRQFVMLLVIGTTTVVVSATALISYSVVRGLILDNLKQNALLKVQRRSDEIDEWLAIQKVRVEAIANTPTARTRNWSVVQPYLQAEVEHAVDFYNFSLANPDGSFYTTKVGRVTVNVKDRKYFQKGMAGQVYVGDPIISRSLKHVVIPIVAPIWSNSATTKQPIGLINGNIRLERVSRVVENLKYGSGSYAFALSSEGMPIVHPNKSLEGNLDKPTPSFLQAKDPDLAKVARHMVYKHSGISRVKMEGKWVYVAYFPLHQADWSIALVIPHEIIESKLEALNLLASVLGGLLAIATIAALWQVFSLEQTRALAEREALLNRLTARIRASLDLDRIVQTTVEELGTLLELQRVAYVVLNPQQQTVEMRREYCKEGTQAELGWFDWSTAAEIESRLQLGEAIYCNRAIASPNASLRQRQAYSYLNLVQPVRQDSVTLGYLICICSSRQLCSKEDKELLQAVADCLAIAITQSQLYTQIQVSEAELRALLEAMSDTVIVFDTQGRYLKYIQWNPAFVYKPTAQRIGKTLHEVLPHQQAEIVFDGIQRALFTQATVKVEYSLPISGKREWFSASASPFMTDKVIFVARNITERKRSESALQQAEEKYRSIFENAVEGIFQTTPDGRYLSANPALARMYGYKSPEELIARLTNIARQLYVEPNRRAQFLAALEQHKELSGFESQIYRSDGSIIWISENARAVRDEQGKLLYYEGIVEDITKRKLTEEALRIEQEKSEQLLLNILPKAIADQLKQNPGSLAERFDEATVLFADIVGFTPLSAQTSPEKLVNLLNEIFSTFDQLAEQHGLEKIKTIGDAYMLAGGLPTVRPDHAEAVAHMALDMQREIARQAIQLSVPVQLRIGINTGPVVAGVIGIKKFIYDLWGDTVNTASRMESHGLPGCIQVTATTYHRCKEKFIFEDRGLVLVKGKGEMLTYLLKGKKF
ncbi:adenylate/guanylate cyclase domain-containing protein [Allocoleopsis sp.]|uniref:adenylate/guanylate cyclase domain-containing protein n=1 Tax=Allocoleopsis sp. TaxID=3088169 RepID=UPI002FCFE8F2